MKIKRYPVQREMVCVAREFKIICIRCTEYIGHSREDTRRGAVCKNCWYLGFEKEENQLAKLSELDEETYLVSDSYGKCIVKDVKEEIIIQGHNATNDRWFLLIKHKWKPDAREMITNYIEYQHEVLYKDFYRKASRCLTNENIQELQTLLEHMFTSNVTDYFELGEQIEMDILPGGITKT